VYAGLCGGDQVLTPFVRSSLLAVVTALATPSCGNGGSASPGPGAGGAGSGGNGGASGSRTNGGSPAASGGKAGAGAAAGELAGGGSGVEGGGTAALPAGGSAGANNAAAGGNPDPGAGGGAGGTTGGTGPAAGAGGSSGASGGGAQKGPWTPAFETITLSSRFYSEGADIGDIDNDGVLDLLAGPVWYKGPEFMPGGELFSPPELERDQYAVFFLAFLDDLDGDGYLDVLGVGDAGGGNGSGNPNSHWYKNPGAQGGTWTKQTLYQGLVSNESPAYLDLVGDERRELVFMTERKLGYAQPGATPADPWTFTAVSGTTMFGTPYVHGLGVGDVDGDGRKDIVERSGWWKQPATLGGAWERHEVDFGAPLANSRPNNWGGAQMHVFDVDGDGDSDVVTSLAAHAYGLVWHEQQDALDTFEAHTILPTAAGSENLSQLHALSVADINGDGLLDLVTGKRYYAHPSTNPDPGTEDSPEIRWFELTRNGASATFTSRTIHAASGVGCNFTIRDVDGNGRPDVFIANKHGAFLHRQ
jgi:hypothetical protein